MHHTLPRKKVESCVPSSPVIDLNTDIARMIGWASRSPVKLRAFFRQGVPPNSMKMVRRALSSPVSFSVLDGVISVCVTLWIGAALLV